jgi:hypothetical protein
MDKTELKVKEKLNQNIDEISALNILYLKYIKTLEENENDIESFDIQKFFDYECSECFLSEIENINAYFQIEIVKNPFKSILINKLRSENLIEFSKLDRIQGICISDFGIYSLKKAYKIDQGEAKDIIVYNTIIINTINNITNEITKEEDKKSFAKKVGIFLKGLGEKTIIELVSKPENIQKVIELIKNING